MSLWKSLLLSAVTALTFGALTPEKAEAKGTHFVLELNTGLGESAYQQGPMGLAYGASFGFTWKMTGVPLRFALLGTIAGRNTNIAGAYDGLSFAHERDDLDVYVAQRLGIPIVGLLRFYGEAGIGQRIRSEELRLGGDYGTLSSTTNEMLIVLAAGLQARLSENFSLGLRGELMPLVPRPDLALEIAHVAPTTARTALLIQIGVHF